jgi:hypothetical protein
MSCHQFSCNHGGEICSFLSGLTVTTNDEAVGWVAEVRLDFDSFILSTVYERDKKTLACEEFASELNLEAHGMYCTPHSMVTMAYQIYRTTWSTGSCLFWTRKGRVRKNKTVPWSLMSLSGFKATWTGI